MGFYPFAPPPGGSGATLIPPSGDSSGVTDVKAINAALAAGKAVQLANAPLATPYYISAPITPVSQSRIWGTQWWSASNNDSYSAGSGASGGTVIVMVPSGAFTAGTAGIQMVNATGTQYYGVDLAGFTIEGFETGGSGVYGILVDGAWGAGFIRGVCVHRPDQDCIRFRPNITTSFIPDDWLISESKFSASRNGYGVYARFLDDSWFIGCESSENDLDNWYIGAGTNTRLNVCKGENSAAGAGFRFGGMPAGEQVEVLGCTTNLNSGDGFLFDNTETGGLGTYLLTGCVSSNDNQSVAAGLAGFRSSACKSRVIANGCMAIGADQVYGASEVSASYGMTFTGSWLTGSTAATHDDGSNTHVLVNQVPVAALCPGCRAVSIHPLAPTRRAVSGGVRPPARSGVSRSGDTGPSRGYRSSRQPRRPPSAVPPWQAVAPGTSPRWSAIPRAAS